MVSCPMMPLGPASVGSGEGSVFFTAARVAEAAGRAQAEGKKRRCSRNSRDVITPEECLERFRAGDPVCVNEFHGRCSTGALEEAKEDKNMGSKKKNYGKCVRCGLTGNRNSEGLCYYAKCKKERVEEALAAIAALPDPWKKKEPPEPGRDGTPGVAAVQGDEAAISGQAEPFEKIEELPAQVQPQASAILDREEVAALDAVIDQDHSGEPTTMVPDLPEDLDRPFSLWGFDFEPVPPRRVFGSRLAAIKPKALSIRTGAIREHGLDRYGFARIAVSVDGKALAIKFYAEHHPGACKVQCKRKSSALIAMESLTKAHPEWIGREAALEWMGVEGWFLMRVGGEAA